MQATWKRNGTAPEGGVLLAENRGWSLYLLADAVQGWQQIKLVSKTERHSANFKMSWSRDESRLANCSTAKRLDSEMPEVYDWVVAELRR